MNATPDLALRAEIQDLYAEYASCLNEPRFEEWPELFCETGQYKLVPRENHTAGLGLATIALSSRAMMKDRIYGASNTLFHAPYYQRHIISLPRLRLEEDGSVRATTNYVVFRTKYDAMTDILNAGVYHDHIVRENGALRFAEKLCVYDSELIPNSIIYPI